MLDGDAGSQPWRRFSPSLDHNSTHPQARTRPPAAYLVLLDRIREEEHSLQPRDTALRRARLRGCLALNCQTASSSPHLPRPPPPIVLACCTRRPSFVHGTHFSSSSPGLHVHAPHCSSEQRSTLAAGGCADTPPHSAWLTSPCPCPCLCHGRPCRRSRGPCIQGMPAPSVGRAAAGIGGGRRAVGGGWRMPSAAPEPPPVDLLLRAAPLPPKAASKATTVVGTSPRVGHPCTLVCFKLDGNGNCLQETECLPLHSRPQLAGEPGGWYERCSRWTFSASCFTREHCCYTNGWRSSGCTGRLAQCLVLLWIAPAPKRCAAATGQCN